MKITSKSSKKIFAIATLLAITILLNPMVIQSSFAQMADGGPIPHYFGPYPNYATSELPVVTYNPDGSVASVSEGIRKFVDSLPLLGPDGANNLNQYLPVAVADKTTYPGSDYYEIAVVEYYQQMHSDLPPTKLRGYVQIDTAAIPGNGVPLTNLHATAPTPILMPNGQQAIGVDIPRYLGPFIVAEKDNPVRVKFYNLLPTGVAGDLFIPVDTTVMGSGMGPIDDPNNPGVKATYTENRANMHLHGGRTPWISDGTPHQWITPANEDTVYPEGVSVYDVPDMPDPGPGATTLFYTNQQSARLMWYHDHAYGITRLNVYVGGAAGYVLRDAVEKSLISSGIIPVEEIPLVIQDKTFVPQNNGPVTNFYGTFPSQLAFQDPTWDVNKWGGAGSLWYPHVYVPMQNPGDPSGMNTIGRWHYGPWFWPPTTVTNGPVANPYALGGSLYNPSYPYNDMEPSMIPGVPNISAPGESFMDTPIINGIAYPYLEVQPQSYRFRILNAANDRFFNLQLYEASSGIVSKIAVTNGGSGYTAVPAVSISGLGIGATARAIINGGSVTAIEVLTVGSGYSVPPTVTISPPSAGTTATATAQVYTAPTEVGMVPAVLTSGYPEGWPIDGREGGVPDPTKAGPAFIQIGTEGGFLPTPVVLENQPIDWNVDMGTFDAGLINKGTLRIGTAERADVIIDFSQFAGKTLILYNDNPAPEPASDPRQDYYTGRLDMTEEGGSDPIMPGYGSNTRTIMQIKVANTTPAAEYDLTTLMNAFTSTATTTGVFEASQPKIIVPQAAYNTAYNTVMPNVYSNIFDNSLTFTPVDQASPVTVNFQPKQIQDEMGESYDIEYGRMAVFLGTELIRSTAGQQTMLLYGFPEPSTELIRASIAGTQIGTLDDGTQIWKITHNGVDVHTVHWHMFEIQVINRVAWDNGLRVPDANELGWKDTLRVNPLQDTIIAIRAIAPDVPFDLPNSVRPIDPTTPIGETLRNTFDPTGQQITLTNHMINYGWEYVWHCHILSHEEMDMMRTISVAVPPVAPYGLSINMINGNPTYRLTWTDNSLSETDFTVQRSTDNAQTWTTLATIPSTTSNTVGATKNYDDTSGALGTTYYYRVLATNTIGDTFDYTIQNPQAVGFPTMTTNSKPSNIASTNQQLGDVHAAVQGSGIGAIYQESYITSTDTWTGWAALPDGTTADTPAMAIIGATEYIVVKGSDGSSLWYTTRNLATGASTAWTFLTGSTPSAPTLTSDGTRLLTLVVRGIDDRVYYRIFDTATQLWDDWHVIATGVTSEKPTAAILGNKLHIVVRGITLGSNLLWSGSVDLVNNAFDGWKPLAGTTPSAPVLTTTHTTNELCLVVRGENDLLYLNSWNGITWEGWNAVPSGSTPSSPGIAVYENRLHLVVIGMDGSSLWHNYINLNTNTAATWIPLSGSSPLPPALAR